jgi:hypothetical protein
MAMRTLATVLATGPRLRKRAQVTISLLRVGLITTGKKSMAIGAIALSTKPLARPLTGNLQLLNRMRVWPSLNFNPGSMQQQIVTRAPERCG